MSWIVFVWLSPNLRHWWILSQRWLNQGRMFIVQGQNCNKMFCKKHLKSSLHIFIKLTELQDHDGKNMLEMALWRLRHTVHDISCWVLELWVSTSFWMLFWHWTTECFRCVDAFRGCCVFEDHSNLQWNRTSIALSHLSRAHKYDQSCCMFDALQFLGTMIVVCLVRAFL